MDIKEIDKNIELKVQLLDEKLSKSEKKFYHFNSIKNFIIHLIQDDFHNVSKLQALKIFNNKKLLSEYLTLIEKGNTDYNSKDLYNHYVGPIGEFMNRNYNFAFYGGAFQFLQGLKFLTVGLFIDFVIFLVFKKLLFIGSIILMSHFFIKYHMKKKRSQIYGPNY